jgi:hypothetical protein
MILQTMFLITENRNRKKPTNSKKNPFVSTPKNDDQTIAWDLICIGLGCNETTKCFFMFP